MRPQRSDGKDEEGGVEMQQASENLLANGLENNDDTHHGSAVEDGRDGGSRSVSEADQVPEEVSEEVVTHLQKKEAPNSNAVKVKVTVHRIDDETSKISPMTVRRKTNNLPTNNIRNCSNRHVKRRSQSKNLYQDVQTLSASTVFRFVIIMPMMRHDDLY